MIQSQIKFQIAFYQSLEKRTGLQQFRLPMSQQNQQQRPATTSIASPNLNPRTQIQLKQQFKLPKLTMPQSRGRLMSRKQNKAPTYLPNIHDESEKNFRNTDMIHVSKSENDIVHSDQNSARDQFAYEIEEKLKLMVSGQESKNAEMQQPQVNERQAEDLSDDLDFEQKILQNKEIIKMHRKKTEIPQKKAFKPLEMLQKINQFNKIKPNKPQSNYEKKMKEYNMSLENKYLQRKKQSLGIIPEKPQKPVQRAKSKKLLSLKEAAIDEAKLNFGYKQFKSSPLTQPNSLVKSQTKDTSKPVSLMNVNRSQKQSSSSSQQQKAYVKQVIKTEQPTSPSKRINRTSALFDNIQSFLENPIASQKHQKLYKELYKKLKSKSIPELQQQLKQLNEKLGGDQNNETKSTVGRQQSLKQILLTENPMERTVRDWKRVDVKDRTNFHCEESNFEKELDYISYLQQKNSTSLSKFIDQQKIMVEIQINRRLSKSIGKETQSSAQVNKQAKDNIDIRQSNTAEEST